MPQACWFFKLEEQPVSRPNSGYICYYSVSHVCFKSIDIILLIKSDLFAFTSFFLYCYCHIQKYIFQIIILIIIDNEPECFRNHWAWSQSWMSCVSYRGTAQVFNWFETQFNFIFVVIPECWCLFVSCQIFGELINAHLDICLLKVRSCSLCFFLKVANSTEISTQSMHENIHPQTDNHKSQNSTLSSSSSSCERYQIDDGVKLHVLLYSCNWRFCILQVSV
mgnify:CR=1 FL=1